MVDWEERGIVKIGRILHFQSEIRNLRLDRLNSAPSRVMPPCPGVFNLRFLISDWKCRIRPISQFPLVMIRTPFEMSD
jgi:hypothetical protein